ncbi:MAG: type II toxin-antitoxin system Phd/YefM family antitoxin [Alphaproteobacteria bacterium]|nr:type II toxin-antitoxin system Phd/YefM family antitoxin [Alphaproteobacteria bacterium]
MREVALYDAKNALSKLVAEVEAGGEEIVITRHGRPAAKLVAFRREPTLEERKAAGRELLRLREQMAAKFPGPGPTWEEMKHWAEDDEKY